MKTVIYHADSKVAEWYEPKTYDRLIEGLKKNVNSFGMPLVHLTIKGFKGMGDENHFYDLDPEDINWNREKCFIEFLKTCEDDVYWFTEPDSRLVKPFPGLTTDLALLRRNDSVAINQSWRLAKKSSLPFFEEVFSYFPDDKAKKQWHGDSVAFVKMFNVLGQPGVGFLTHKQVTIELRPFALYCLKGSEYTRQWKHHNKKQLLESEEENGEASD
jgi:hypothetical protein